MRNSKKTALMLIISLAAGCAAGFLTAGRQSGVISPVGLFPDEVSLSSLKGFFLTSSASTFIQASLIFVSSFFSYPLLISAPILFIRGAALAYTLASSGLASHEALASCASYAIISALMVILAASLCRYARRRSFPETSAIPRMIYDFLMISGAAIIVKAIPHVLCKYSF